MIINADGAVISVVHIAVKRKNRMVKIMATKQLKTTIKKYEYKIPDKYKGETRAKIQKIIRTEIKKGTQPNDIYNKLKNDGLGYRKQNVLSDIRFKNATINAKSPESRKRAEIWYVNVFEPYRKENKLNSKSAKNRYETMAKQSYKTIESAKRGRKLKDMYEKLFGKLPMATVQEYGKRASRK